MTDARPSCFTAFAGHSRLASGRLAEVALAVKIASTADAPPIMIFDDATGRSIDLDLRGSHREIVARLAPPEIPTAATDPEPRGRGRPKLGVVGREITLLPRHWDWLASQPGGASVALRKLVEEKRKLHADKDRLRAAIDAAYHFMSAIAGDLPGFEEATRALYANDPDKFAALIAQWPVDIRDHARRLALPDR